MNITYADIKFRNLLADLLVAPVITTRNADVHSLICPEPITFSGTPLVSLKKTAWKKAIREMEWFFSGSPKCPEELLDWWEGQLNPEERYLNGYGHQLRYSAYYDYTRNKYSSFDQIEATIKALRSNPNSRRILLTSWNSGDMANITEANDNPNTPTTCHSTLVQFFVRDGALYLYSYQRSADILLGVPHNWIQSWAMLTYFARMSKLEVGSMIWQFGDLHLYKEESHLVCAKELTNTFPDCYTIIEPTLIYNQLYSKEPVDFKATDFSIPFANKLSAPVTTIRPNRL